MKIFNIGAPITVVLLIGLLISSSPEKPSYSSPFEAQIDFSQEATVTTLATIDNQMIYRAIEPGLTTFYSIDVTSGSITELGRVSGYTMSSGATAIYKDALLTYITVGESNDLYKVNYVDMKIEKVSSDTKCSPNISLYSSTQGVLALKNDGNRSYFQLVYDGSKGGSNVPRTVLEALTGESFLIADISDETLFVFVYKQNASGAFDYFIRKYTLDNYSEIDTIDLSPIKSYIDEARIGRMELIGGYIFFENYSNNAVLCQITGDTVSKMLQGENLTMAKDTGTNENSKRFFYIRRTQNCYVFDLKTGELAPFYIPLDEDYVVQILFTDGKDVFVKSKQYSDSKLTLSKERIYLCDYSALLNLVSTN